MLAKRGHPFAFRYFVVLKRTLGKDWCPSVHLARSPASRYLFSRAVAENQPD